jgi:hypothetical protein
LVHVADDVLKQHPIREDQHRLALDYRVVVALVVGDVLAALVVVLAALEVLVLEVVAGPVVLVVVALEVVVLDE